MPRLRNRRGVELPRLYDLYVFGLAGFCIAWSIVELVEILK